jgi:hypothetical protein
VRIVSVLSFGVLAKIKIIKSVRTICQNMVYRHRLVVRLHSE